MRFSSDFPILLIIAALIILFAPVLMACLMHRSYIYHPTSLRTEDIERMAVAKGWDIKHLDTEEGIKLQGILRPPLNPSLPWILFFGGNAMDLGSSLWVLDLLDANKGYGFAVFAYRGYDGSTGNPTEAGILYDSRAIAAMLEKDYGVESENLVLVGQSLGSGIASFLAASLARQGKAVRGLVLLSPYTSMADVFDDHVPLIPVGWAITDKYETMKLLDDIPGPVLIVHGRRDDLIVVEHGKKIAEALGERARLVIPEMRGHNDLWDDPITLEAIRDLLDSKNLNAE